MPERPAAMPDLATPVAPRLRRPSWRDPRLGLGLLLVVGSVALGSWAVSSAARTVAVYAVAETVVPGDPVRAEDLVVVDVRLGAETDLYYAASQEVPADLVALRPVGERELLARAAVGSAADLDFRSVAVPAAGTLSSSVVPGALVDLWFVPEQESGADAASPPALLAERLVVAELGDERGGSFVAGGARTIHVLVPTSDLPDVLAALSSGGAVSIMPVPGVDG